jgi:hypothetical protein
MAGVRCDAGLFLASLALHMAAPAKRFAPEPLAFAVRLLRSAMPQPGAPQPQQQQQQQPQRGDPSAPHMGPGTWLQLGGSKGDKSFPVPPLRLTQALGSDPADAYFGSAGFRAAALAAAFGLVGRAAQVFAGVPSLPEVLAPAQAALEALGSVPGLPKARPCLNRLPLPSSAPLPLHGT